MRCTTYFLAATVAVCAVACSQEHSPSAPASSTPAATTASNCVIDALMPSEIRDPKVLAKHSTNVFVGKVTNQVGTHDELSSPTTQFGVDVLLNLKGSAENHVTVNQAGGTLDGRLCLVNNDPLLAPGAVYLFSTTHGSSSPLYAVTASGYGNIRLSGSDAAAIAAGPPTPEPDVVAKMRQAIG